VFLLTAVFAGLLAFELLRDQPPARDIVMPLALAASGFVVVAVVSAGSALVAGDASTDAQLSALRGMNAVGTLVISTCAAFTLVLLVRAETVTRGDAGAAERARRRLRKAEAQNDAAWSVLDIRLDDPEDLREASSTAAFARIADRFHDDIQESPPPSADAERVDDAWAVVLIRGSDEAIRFHIRAILSRVSVIDDGSSLSGIRSSASIGWASAATSGFDYDVLAAEAARAAARARAAGGDQWKRATEVDALAP
jgi:GGDEF domain-containing protein